MSAALWVRGWGILAVRSVKARLRDNLGQKPARAAVAHLDAWARTNDALAHSAEAQAGFDTWTMDRLSTSPEDVA